MTDPEEAAEPVADRSADEAQAAANGLKDQIAAVRARVRTARDTLHEHARRRIEPRSFER